MPILSVSSEVRLFVWVGAGRNIRISAFDSIRASRGVESALEFCPSASSFSATPSDVQITESR
jgi:hypothetical protein